jgi:hypothetical protein
MRRFIPLLIVVLAVQLGLAALLASRRNPLASIAPQSPLLGAVVQGADRLLLDGGGTGSDAGHVELARRNGQWILPGYFAAPADQQKVSDLLSQLATLQRGLPIATSAAALERFKLADDNFERRLTLSQAGHALGTLYVGSADGARRSDVRTVGDQGVFSVELPSSQLPPQPGAWIEPDLLTRGSAALTGLDVMTPKGSVHLLHQGSPTPTWSASDLPRGHKLDADRVNDLDTEIGSVRPQGIVGTAPLPAWHQDQPVLTLTLHSAHGSQNWVLSQATGSSDYVLKSSAQPWYFDVDGYTGRQLLAAAEPSMLIIDPVANAKAAAAAAAAADASATGKRPQSMVIHHLAHPRSAGPGAQTSTSTRDSAPDVGH